MGQFLSPSARRLCIALVPLAFVGGLLEGAVLVVVVKLAGQLAGDDSSLSLGPLSIPIDSAADLTIVGGVLLVMSAACMVTGSALGARVQADVMQLARRRLGQAFARADIAHQSARPASEVVELLTVQITAVDSIAFNLMNLTSAATIFVAYLALAIATEPIAALVAGIAGLVLHYAIQPFGKAARRAAKRSIAESQRYVGWTSESIALAREIKVAGVGEASMERSTRLARTLAESTSRQRLLLAIAGAAYQSAALGLVLGGIAVVRSLDVASPSSLGAVIVLLVRALSYGQRITQGVQTLSSSVPRVEAVFDAVQELEGGADHFGGEDLELVQQLELDLVEYGYLPSHPVLHGVSLRVDAGESIGIVGPSGSGKTTLVQILLRLRTPWSGQYLVNGKPAASYSADAWSRAVALVPQDNRMLTGTLIDNVQFLRDVDRDDAVEALRAAALDSASLPDGDATVVGPGIRELSGGQAQRLGLARALAVHPTMLVLDEPTSALDAITEATIQTSLLALKGTTTTFIVAHRLSTLDVCDRVIVMRDGHIDAFGPLDDLRRTNDYVRRAYELARLPDSDVDGSIADADVPGPT